MDLQTAYLEVTGGILCSAVGVDVADVRLMMELLKVTHRPTYILAT